MSMKHEVNGLGTLAVHAGEPTRKAHGAVTTPISCTATYVFDDTAEMRDHFEGRIDREEYGRYGNPTVRIAERKLAAVDGAGDCVIFSSGMAAITSTLFAMVRQGQHVILTSDCYRRTRQFVTQVLGRFGVESSIVDPDDYDGLASAIQPDKTRFILSESPTNPYLRCLDIERVAEVKKRYPGVKLLIDATFATPINQRPLSQGADLVFHSCTKYLAGHNDMLGGAVLGPTPLISALREFRGVLGGILDAHSAYLLIRGLKTLELRVARQNQSAMAIAQALDSDPRIERVFYPGLESHPDHQIAKRHMKGFGGVVSFLVKGDLDTTSRFVDRCRLPVIGPSLGGVESLIEQPALMSFYELTTEQREAIGIKDNLVRLSVGVESTEDLVRDLSGALDAAVSGA
ncbi:MAG: aminotransferase class I/II-fold pyridoxal phosphate-dependent enzyme [Proteobacteria bacterium]|nr:aminotransferase class I/II-fold pyridoxal phosphate-dependent enzyme [Pseudomonadota bacterium]